MFHPSNAGHSVMADCIEYLFEKIDQAGHASLNAFMGVLAIVAEPDVLTHEERTLADAIVSEGELALD